MLLPPSWYRPVGLLGGALVLVLFSQVFLIKLIDPGSGEVGTGRSQRLLGPAQVGEAAYFYGFELDGPSEPCSPLPIGDRIRSSGAAGVAIPLDDGIDLVETIFVDATPPDLDPAACPGLIDEFETVVEPTRHGWRRSERATSYEEVIDIRPAGGDVIVVWVRSETEGIDVAEVEAIADRAVTQHGERRARAPGTLTNRLFVALITLVPAGLLFGLTHLLRRIVLVATLLWLVLYAPTVLLVRSALGYSPVWTLLVGVVVTLIATARSAIRKELDRIEHPMPQAAGGPAAETDPRSIVAATVGSGLEALGFAPAAGPCVDAAPAAVWQWWHHRDGQVVAEVMVHSRFERRPVVSMATSVGNGRAVLSTTNRGDLPPWIGGLQMRKPGATIDELWQRHSTTVAEAADLGVDVDAVTSVDAVQRHHVETVRAAGRIPLVCAASAAWSLFVGRFIKRWQPAFFRRWVLDRLAR